MAITFAQTRTWLDSSMPDGYLRVVWSKRFPHYTTPEIFLTKHTFQALACQQEGLPLVRLYEVIKTMEDGTYRLPSAVMDTAAAEDLRRVLEVAEPAEGQCTMTGCLQDVVSSERGFPLCQLHVDLLQDWDSLVA